MAAMLLTQDLVAFPAILLGAFLEGEAALLSATVLSTIGTFHTWTVFVAGVLGTMAGDQLVYWIGRTVRDPSRARLFGRAIVSPKITGKAQRFFQRHGGAAVIILRFAYGTRTTGYFLAGASRMRFLTFFTADLVGTLVWVSILVGLGLLIGPPLLGFFQHGGGWAIAAGMLLLFGLIYGIIQLQKRIRLSPDTR